MRRVHRFIRAEHERRPHEKGTRRGSGGRATIRHVARPFFSRDVNNPRSRGPFSKEFSSFDFPWSRFGYKQGP